MSPEASAAVLLEAIAKLFFISAMGYCTVRFSFLSTTAIEALSKFIIVVSLPCLIIATVGRDLHYDMLGMLGLGALAAFVLSGMSIVFALLFRGLFLPRHEKGRNLFLSLSAIQNAGYLPIPLVTAILPNHLRAEGLLLTFVYIFVMGFVFWSLGVWLVTEKSVSDWRGNMKKTINPPMLALFAGLLFLLPPVKARFDAIPLLQETLSLVGTTTIPLIMFVLGGSFGSESLIRGTGGRIIGLSVLVKLAVIPTVTLLAVKALAMERSFGFILMLQAAMPAAMNHIVVARGFGGNVPLISRALFLHYTVSVFTIPLFLYLFDRLYQ